MRDGALIKSANLPAAGASASTVAIEIGTGPHLRNIEVRTEIEALRVWSTPKRQRPSSSTRRITLPSWLSLASRPSSRPARVARAPRLPWRKFAFRPVR